MSTAPSYDEAISILQTVYRRTRSGDTELADIRKIEEARDTVIPRYQAVFARDGLTSLTDQDVREFLQFRNNQHWISLQRMGPAICQNWGIHLTGASARRADNPPWSVRGRAFQAGRVPTGARRRRWLHFGCGVNDEVPVAHRVVRNGELEHPIEHHPAAAGAAAVEAEYELTQVAGQVRGVD